MQTTEDLKRQSVKKKNYYSNEIIPKISISDEEYNAKLKKVETGLKVLAKKYKFLHLPTFYYKDLEEEED